MKKMKQKKISMETYTAKMDKIINKQKPIDETLIEMLNEASRYEIKEL